MTAGAFNPTGTATPVDGGFRVSGRWAFASGCEHADVLYGNCIEGVVDGMPQMRIAVFAPDQVVIEDTWHVAGLCGHGQPPLPRRRPRGAGGADVRAARGPAVHRRADHADPAAAVDRSRHRERRRRHRAGRARRHPGAGEDKVPLLASGPLATQPMFQVRARRRRTPRSPPPVPCWPRRRRSLWGGAVAGEPLTDVERARARSAAVWAVDRAVSVVETAYRWGGGTSLYRTSPLQRRLRDVHAITQHFLVRRDTLVTAGAFLAGLDVPVLVF